MIEETLRPMTASDHAFVLDLNERHVDLLAPMDEARLRELRGWADRAEIVMHEGEPAGFVLTFGPGTAYDSENYRWFTAEYAEEFYYLDRIVLAEEFRRSGIGRAVYDELERTAIPFGRMALEVNAEPPNEASLAFHRGRGYVEVGRLGDGGKKVALLAKDLPPRVPENDL